jgi:hypothetical protein
MGHLKSRCEHFIAQGIENDNAFDLLQAAEIYQANRLKIKCLDYICKMKNYEKLKEYKELAASLKEGTILNYSIT